MKKQKFDELGEQWLELRDVPKEGLFRLSSGSNAPVWVRGDYDRASKKYVCNKYDNYWYESGFGGKRKVYVGFEF